MRIAPAAPPPTATPDAQGVSAGEIQRLYDAYALVQAQEALRLTDEHYVRFVARLKTLQEIRRRHVVARNRILQDLRRLTNAQTSAADEAEMRDRLKALRDEEARGAAEVRKAYDAVDELLDVRQQAQFRLFEEQMDRKRLDLLMRARQNVRGRRGGN
jgi:phosphoglycolate phosphatase-like HAD superfamily hydrolase